MAVKAKSVTAAADRLGVGTLAAIVSGNFDKEILEADRRIELAKAAEAQAHEAARALDGREAALGPREAALDEREEAILAREAAIEPKERSLSEDRAKQAESARQLAAERAALEDERAEFFDTHAAMVGHARKLLEMVENG